VEVSKIETENERCNRLVELNVQEQYINLTKMGVVQKACRRNNYPIIHGWVSDVSTGTLIDLQIDFQKILFYHNYSGM
jgi:carbonic anhydrase